MKIAFCLGALFLLFVASAPANACSGSCGTRGGGDFIEWSFYDAVNALLPKLRQSETQEVQAYIPGMSRVSACLKVEISPKPSLDLDGRSVAAINIPAECKIILSRVSWENLKTIDGRVRLVFHELLSLAGVDDFQYSISQLLLEEYFRLDKNPSVSRVNQYRLFTKSEVFVVPLDVHALRVTVVGGGGGGGGGHLNRGSGGGGGGGGAVRTREIVLDRQREIMISVGQGGRGASQGGVNGSNGESSSFGHYLTAIGGGGGFSGYYDMTQGYGGTGGGSGGGGGGNGVRNICSGQGGAGGSRGSNGWASSKSGIGGSGGAWDSLTGFFQIKKSVPGSGGVCPGAANTYNGGGGGGGLLLPDWKVMAQSGGASQDLYSGNGGTGGEGFGAGGGGGTGANGEGGDGAPGLVYIEFLSFIDRN